MWRKEEWRKWNTGQVKADQVTYTNHPKHVE
jgi:hypothetical protein